MLEHLSKDKGKILLNDVERVSKETIIITTPNNPVYRAGTMSFEGFNPYDTNISKWDLKDLHSKNYYVFGCGFCFNALNRYKSIPILKVLLSPISFFFPSFACYFVAIKKRSGKPSLGKILKRLYPVSYQEKFNQY